MSSQVVPRVIAVVPTYNRKVMVAQVIDAILSQSTPVARTILIDNGSIDGTGEFLHESGYLSDSRLEYLRLETNTGFSGAFHYGIEQAMAHLPDWIWALDDDALPDPRCVENLLEAVDRYQGHKIGGLMSYQHQWSGRPVRYRYPTTVWEALRYGYGCPQIGVRPGDSALRVDWFTTVSALVSAAAVQQVGLPRNDLFYYADPLEYSLRLRAAGYEAFLVPQSLVDHRSETGPGKKVPKWRWYYVYRNTIFVLKNHAGQLGRPVQVAATLRMTVGALARMLKVALTGDWRTAQQIGKGVMDGYLGRLGQRITPSVPT